MDRWFVENIGSDAKATGRRQRDQDKIVGSEKCNGSALMKVDLN